MAERAGEPKGKDHHNTDRQHLIDHQIMCLNLDSLCTQDEFEQNLADSIHCIAFTHEGISVYLNLGDEPDNPKEPDQAHILVLDHYQGKLQVLNKESGELETLDLPQEQQEGLDAYVSRAGRSLVNLAKQLESRTVSSRGLITYTDTDTESLEQILATSVLEGLQVAQELEARFANAPGAAEGENFSRLQKARALTKCMDTANDIFLTTLGDQETEPHG